MPDTPPPEPDHPPASARRLAGVVLLAGGLLLAGWLLGAEQRFDLDALRATVQGAGPLGPLVFTGVFCLGELLHVPGLVFVGAALVVWGPLRGAGIAFLGALCSVSCTFLLVRAVGGQPAAALRWGWARRALAHLERRPVLTVAALRAVLILSPPLNYALALTPLRFRDHLLGSALGLILPIALACLASSWLVERLP